jgi:hypothetical protein
MAVLLLQAALIDESNFTFLCYCPTVASILLDRDDFDRIGFQQRFTPRRKTLNSRFEMLSDRNLRTLETALS